MMEEKEEEGKEEREGWLVGWVRREGPRRRFPFHYSACRKHLLSPRVVPQAPTIVPAACLFLPCIPLPAEKGGAGGENRQEEGGKKAAGGGWVAGEVCRGGGQCWVEWPWRGRRGTPQ